MISCLTAETQDVDLADVSSSHGMALIAKGVLLLAILLYFNVISMKGPAPSRRPSGLPL